MSGYGSTGNGDQTRQTDEYGNPIQKTGGEYGTGGNTGAHVTHTGGGEYGTGGNTGVTHSTGGGEYGTGGNTGLTQSTGGEYGTGVPKDHDKGGILHRSNSSSSSSEDDGQGGRRKKSIVDKIKNKLPGGPKEPASTVGQGATAEEGYGHGHGATNTTTAHETYGADGQPEKKGFVEKIKEKLPGSHN